MRVYNIVTGFTRKVTSPAPLSNVDPNVTKRDCVMLIPSRKQSQTTLTGGKGVYYSN